MMTNATSVVCKIINYYMKISLQEEEKKKNRTKLKDPTVTPDYSPLTGLTHMNCILI